jgi:GNAT superfamily N-acetyltransferase
MPTTDIVRGYTPGAIGRIAEMHGRYYGREWGFPSSFEALVAREVADFVDGCDPAREGLWLLDGERVLGSIALVRPRDGEPARLRWFITADAARGSGAGALLMQAAMDFARQAGYRRLYLTTFAGLDAARHLYERHGFVLTAESRDDHWGAAVNEQRFDWHA